VSLQETLEKAIPQKMGRKKGTKNPSKKKVVKNPILDKANWWKKQKKVDTKIEVKQTDPDWWKSQNNSPIGKIHLQQKRDKYGHFIKIPPVESLSSHHEKALYMKRTLKEIIKDALAGLGGTRALINYARKNDRNFGIFLGLVARCVPFDADAIKDAVIEIKIDDAAKEL